MFHSYIGTFIPLAPHLTLTWEEVSQTHQRHAKDPASNQALWKISLGPALFISATAASEARVKNILDAFVSRQPHAILICFLDQPAMFFYGPKLLSGEPLCYFYLVTKTRGHQKQEAKFKNKHNTRLKQHYNLNYDTENFCSFVAQLY